MRDFRKNINIDFAHSLKAIVMSSVYAKLFYGFPSYHLISY